MNLKKVLSAALSVALFGSVFTGCSDKSADSSAKVVTIWGNGAGTKVEETIAKNYNETIGKKKGIRIDYQVKDGDVNQQVEIALQSGDAPDIFRVGKLKECVEKNYLAPLTAFKGGREIFDESVKKGGLAKENVNMINGAPYTITNSVLTFGIIYNKEMFKAAGLVDENGEPTPPETWDEFREYAKRLTNKSKRQFGVIFPLKWGAWYGYEINCNTDASSDSISFDVDKMQYDYSDMNGILNTIIGIKNDGSCYPGAEGIDNDPARARFAEGNIGMKLSVSWDVGVFKEQFPTDFDWGVAPVPTYSKDKKYKQYMTMDNAGYINGKVLNTDRQDAVWEVWKYWYGPEKNKILFEEGISLPLDFDSIKDVNTDIHGWKEFAELVKISGGSFQPLPTLTTGEKSLKELFIDEVWNGKMTVEEATKIYTDISNRGIDRYYEQNPSADKEKDMEETRNSINTLR